MDTLEDFIYSEQVRNNFSLYSSKVVNSLFKMDLKQDFIPENRAYFKIPYFVIPITTKFFKYNPEYESFLRKNYFIKKAGKLYYPFFIHPTTEKIFKLWIKDKYKFIDSDNSKYLGTPTSSYRTLSIINIDTEEQFFVKTSLFGNVANGSRHIDWKSAEGQFFFSTCTANASKSIENLSIFKDICASGIQGNANIDLSHKYLISFGPKTIDIAGNIIRVIPKTYSSKQIVCSIASFTSLNEKEPLFLRAFNKSNKGIEEFFFDILYKTIITPFINLYSKFGISLEIHCQNTLIELSPEFELTGKVLYRDFDITSLDRARFPFIFKEKWNEYCYNRFDRTTYYSNLCAREDIYINFFNHFISNLIEPCLTCASKLHLLSKSQYKEIYFEIINDLKQQFNSLIPKSSDAFKKAKTIKCYSKYFNNIDLSEIPTKINKLTKLNLDDYDEFYTATPELPITNIWTSENGIIFSSNNNILRSIFNKKVFAYEK